VIQRQKVPFQQGEFLAIEGFRADGNEHDRSTLHDELVDVLDEHQRRWEIVVNDQILETIEEDYTQTVVVLDEFLDYSCQRANRGRWMEIQSGGVAEPDDPDIGDVAFLFYPIRVLTSNYQPWFAIAEEVLERCVREIRRFFLEQIARAPLNSGSRAARCSRRAP